MIRIKDLRHDYDGSPGDHLVVRVGHSTEIIIDTGDKHPGTPDIRVSDRQATYKLELDEDYAVRRVLRDDTPMTQQH